jgi:RNA 2',3'-cyclic 3'-phosphodiesterase
MPKLFVAVDMPAVVTAALARMQPPPMPGVRLAAQHQMHLTLHFIGEADIDRMAAALSAVRAPAFALTIEGVGQFPSADGSVTLWAGVRASTGLAGLHGTVAAALAGEGFRPEEGRYTPHVTLARCGPQIPAGLVGEFLNRHSALSLPTVALEEFALYSSAFVGDGPVYTRERRFPLVAA